MPTHEHEILNNWEIILNVVTSAKQKQSFFIFFSDLLKITIRAYLKTQFDTMLRVQFIQSTVIGSF